MDKGNRMTREEGERGREGNEEKGEESVNEGTVQRVWDCWSRRR